MLNSTADSLSRLTLDKETHLLNLFFALPGFPGTGLPLSAVSRYPTAKAGKSVSETEEELPRQLILGH